MINYPGGRTWGCCLDALAAAGIALGYTDNVPDFHEAAAQSVVDAVPIDAARAELVAPIKAMARDKILAFLPEWRQSNANARMSELLKVRSDRAWTADESAEVAALDALWARAKAIRTASNTHEAAIAAADWATLGTYDITAGWPE